MLKVFIGYDSREAVAYHVCAHSIMARAKTPVAIIPLALHSLPMYTRPMDSLQSTEFAYSRFLVPYLSDYRGYSVFMDSDMLVRCDINEIMDLIDAEDDVSCVKHDYTPKTTIKFLGQKQSTYPRKNWSSVMLFNASHAANRRLSLRDINERTARRLHSFYWLHDSEIGGLLPRWNWLVDQQPRPDDLGIAHMTLGGPWLEGWQGGSFDDEWRAEGDR